MKYFFLKLRRVTLQLLFLLLCYSVSRCIFVLVNHQYFAGLNASAYFSIALRAMRFDISAILVVNALYLLLFFFPFNMSESPRWERFTQAVFVACNSFACLFDISDWAYFPFTLKRETSDVLNMITRKGDFVSLLPHFVVDYWYVPLAGIINIAGIIYVNNRIRKKTPLQLAGEPHSWLYKGVLLLQLIFVVPFIIIGIRGGVSNYVPIGLKDAVKVANGNYVPIVLNTPFSIINTLYADRLQEVNYMPEADAEKYISTTKQYRHDAFRKKNVVVIILESFSKEFTRLGRVGHYTPFLDSLMSVSYTCTNAYANGLHSAEGIPAVIAGIPAMMEEPFATSVYGTNRITSLPGVLKEQGYSSAFYHGGTNGTMSFDLFCANAGFDKYYGRTEYANEADYDGNWGIWDEPYLQYFAAGLGKMPQPFCATVFTLSSHDPYRVPDKYKARFPQGKIPIEAPIAYADMALREFFATASQQPWFSNTLFVLSADHAALSHEDDYYAGNMGRYAIPILFYAPGDTALRGAYEPVAQQIDILPSVLDYLGYSKPFFALGNSIFTNTHRFAFNEFQGSNQWLMDGYLLQASAMNAKGLFAFPADSACKNNLLPADPAPATAAMQYLKAFRQQYTSALINNKMYIK